MIPSKTEGAASRSHAPTSERRRRPVYRRAPDGLVVWDKPGGKWSRPPAFTDAAARLVSSAEDLLAFARRLLRGGAPSCQPTLAGHNHRPADPGAEGPRGLVPGFFRSRSWGFYQAVYDSGAFGWDGGLGTS